MVEVAAELGAGSVTVADVVGRSGVSRRTFYELFTDRNDCFMAAFDDGMQCASRYLLDAHDPTVSWREQVRIGVTGLLCFVEDEPNLGRLLIVESLAAGPEVLERRSRALAQIVAIVDRGRSEARPGHDPSPLTAEGVVGGVLSVLHARLLQKTKQGSLLQLVAPFTSAIVLPYLGNRTAQQELKRPTPQHSKSKQSNTTDPLRDVHMRLTYRTVRVLTAIAELGGRGSYPSNREVGLAAGMQDQGQTSKLLSRLHKLGLIENTGAGLARGAPNAWTLTPKGTEIERAIGDGTGR
jgi:AcrR family transcriptional regulator